MATVYDPENQRITTSDSDYLKKITGVGPGGAADDILGRERAAASGGQAAKGDTPGPSSGKKANAKSRADLQYGEKDSPFKPSNNGDSGKKSGGTKTTIKGRARKAYVAAALIASLMGGGVGAGIAGEASGPLQVIHIAQTVGGDHFGVGDDQSDTRIMHLWRLARNVKAGTPERANLGRIGNKIADAADVRLNASGLQRIKPEGFFGFFNGYAFDPARLKGGIFDTMNAYDRGEGFGDFMKKNFGFDVKAIPDSGGKYVVGADQFKGFKFNRFTRSVIAGSGAPRFSWIGTRFMGERARVTWKPIWADLNNFGPRSIDALTKAWTQRRDARIRAGAAAPSPNVTRGAPDEDGDGKPDTNEDGTEKPPSEESEKGKSELDKLLQDSAAATDGGDAEAALKEKITAKLKVSAGILTVFEYVCLLLYIFQKIEFQRFKNVQLPSMRVGVEFLSLAGTYQSGQTLAQNGKVIANASKSMLQQLNLYGERLYDKQKKNGVMQAESIALNHGHRGGVATPEGLKLGSKDSFLYKMFNFIVAGGTTVTQALVSTCHVITNQVFGFVVSAILIATGIAKIAGVVVGYALSYTVLPVIVDLIVQLFSGREVASKGLAGATWGSTIDVGLAYAANDRELSNAAQELPDVVYSEMRNNTIAYDKQVFQSKSLAYRLFDNDDPKSLISQFVDQQTPDASANMARYAGSFLNIGRTFTSLFGSQLQLMTGKADAAALPYNYGFPMFGFSQADMDSAEFQDPYTNAENAAQMLEAANQKALAEAGEEVADAAAASADNDLVKKIKTCTGDDAVRRVDDKGEWYWSIGPPVADQIPTYEAYDRGYPEGQTDVYNCQDQSADYRSIRSFVAYSKDMNSEYCYDGADKDPDTVQSCTDAGFAAALVENDTAQQL
jgi:hypothetical protein